MKRIFFNSFSFWLLILFPIIAKAQDVNDNVVKIVTHYSDIKNGGVSDFEGSGIIIGYNARSVYALTAKHVLLGPEGEKITKGAIDSVRITFYQHAGVTDPGTLVYQFPHLDLAIIEIPKPAGFHGNIKKLKRAKFNKIRKRGLKILGYPGDYCAVRNVARNPSFDYTKTYVVYGPGGLEPGFSGGPLLTSKKDHLVGINISTGGDSNKAIYIGEIFEKFSRDEINVPNQLIRSTPGTTDLALIFGTASIVKIGTGIFFHRQEQKYYDRYLTYRDEEAFEKEFPGLTREGAFKKAKKFKKMEVISYGAAVACLTLGIIDHVRYKKGKKPLFHKLRKSNYYGSFTTSEPAPASNSTIGLALNFDL